MENHKAGGAKQNSDDNLQELYKSAIKFLTPITLEETHKKIVSEAIRLVGADCGSLFAKNDGQLDRVYAYPPSLFKNKIRKRGFTYRAWLKKEPSLTHVNKIAKAHPSVIDLGIKSTIYVPLVNKDEKIGLLSIDFLHEQEDFQKELSVLKIFSFVASLAIRKAQLYDEIKSTLAERDLFISLAAHEIRTPLTIVLLYADLLHKNVQSGKMPNLKWSKIILDEGARLRAMTDELLSVEQLKGGLLQYHFENTDFKSLIARAFDNFKMLHPKNSLNYADKIKSSIEIIADSDKLLQVLTNILNNAYKYSPEKSPIDVTLSERGRNIFLTVKDKGIGIEKADLNKIFEKYYQSRIVNRKGLGIGLYLAKVIVEMHKGKILAKSKVNKGTKIIVRLPKLKRAISSTTQII